MEGVAASPHRAAALAYGGLGVLVVFITFAAGLVPPTREGATGQLLVGALFVLIFAALLWRGWWLLAAFLVFSNAWRAINYVNHGLGLHVELRTLGLTPIEPRPVAFVNAALMGVIVVLLARSAWTGFAAWRVRRGIERES